MKFVMSYSCGKDSTLALHKMIEMGHEPVALLVMVNIDAGRSYFHGADEKLLDEFSEALGIPMILCPAKGEEYHLKFEAGLMEARKLGAEAACFGDIDIEGNRKWSQPLPGHGTAVGIPPLAHGKGRSCQADRKGRI